MYSLILSVPFHPAEKPSRYSELYEYSRTRFSPLKFLAEWGIMSPELLRSHAPPMYRTAASSGANYGHDATLAAYLLLLPALIPYNLLQEPKPNSMSSMVVHDRYRGHLQFNPTPCWVPAAPEGSYPLASPEGLHTLPSHYQ